MKWPSKEELDELNLWGVLTRIPENDSFKQYVSKPAGVEHYRLLVWIGHQLTGKTLVEVGVYKGLSGCALGHSNENKVIGFDVVDNISCKMPANYTFFIGEIILNDNLIKQAPFIMYDTNHDGVHEKLFYNWLVKINYKGMVLFDDIYLNDEMKKFWENITHKKEDISHIGHATGTGVVWF